MKATVADTEKNPPTRSSPPSLSGDAGEKPGSYLKKGLFENLHGTSAAEAEGFCHELCRCYAYWS